jgi:hopanoid biosynthesis associated RND transporter like protein HpnN
MGLHMNSESPEEVGLVPRVLAWAVGVICAHPWVVLSLTLLSCAVCGVYTWNNLTYLTHRNDLISNKKEYLKRWHQYVEEFGDDDDMVVVIRGDDRKKMESVLDEMALEIKGKPESFERLFYKVDLTNLHARALLFLPTDQVRQIQSHIQGMSLLLEPPVLAQFNPLFGWKMLSVQQLLRESERRLEVWKEDQPHTEAENFFRQLDTISHGASDFLEGGKDGGQLAPRVGFDSLRESATNRYRSPWRSVLPSPPTSLPKGEGNEPAPSQEDRLATPQYFFSSDGKLAFLLVSPVKDPDPDNFTYAQKSIDSLRELIALMKSKHADVEIGLTGLPVLENDEMVASQNDSNFASWLALIGVALLYLVVYRGFRYPLMTVLALIVGTIWAVGWLTLTVGHLNILSSAFAVMLIGMGDYGVLWVTRFGQERQAGHDIFNANRQTAMHVGPSIFTAAVTTAFSFFAAMLADLKAVSELGWIAGCGVLLCAFSCFVVVPALLTIFDFRVHPSQAKDEMILSMQEHQEARREWLSWLMRKPRWVVVVCGFATLVLAGFAWNIDYDHNLLNLQAQQMDSVKWEKKLMEHMSDSSWYAVSWTTTPEEALALKAKYERLPEVSTVITAASLIPAEQERKIELLRDIKHRLRTLPKRGETIEHEAPNVDDVTQTGERVLRLLTARQKEKPNESMAQLQRGVERLLATIRKAQAPDGEAPAEPGVIQATHLVAVSQVKQQLRQFDEWMTRDLAEDLHRLRDVSTPTPIRLDDLPTNLRERYIGKNGKWLVRIFSKDCLWNFDPLQSFVQQVRTVDPEATGKPFTTLEGLKAMRNGFLWAGVYALIAMVLVLLVDFGRIKHTLVALLPLAMGMIATLGFMAMFGFSLNPANMIAFPLILGVGADNGVHVLHDFRGRDRRRRYRLTHITGFGIMVAALTTILGFGTLIFAEHRGMASLGLILTVGVTCCMLTALVFLPALLYVMGKREKTVAEPATLPLPEREAA